MGIRGTREVTVVISGTFDANELVDEIRDLCDGRPEEYDGFLLSVYNSTDQRDSSTATLNFSRKAGIKSRPKSQIMNATEADDEPAMEFDKDPFAENSGGIPR